MKEDSTLTILYHDEVGGINKKKERVLISYEVDDIESEVKRMEEDNV